MFNLRIMNSTHLYRNTHLISFTFFIFCFKCCKNFLDLALLFGEYLIHLHVHKQFFCLQFLYPLSPKNWDFWNNVLSVSWTWGQCRTHLYESRIDTKDSTHASLDTSLIIKTQHKTCQQDSINTRIDTRLVNNMSRQGLKTASCQAHMFKTFFIKDSF